MATTESVVRFKAKNPCKLVKWKIHSGSRLSLGTVLFLYEHMQSDECKSVPRQYLKFKSSVEGTVKNLLAKEGSTIKSECELLELQACTHQVIMKDMCAECGADLRQLDSDNLAKVAAVASVSMIHSIPELRVSHEQAQLLGQADEERLLRNRKLVLLVDLDQTLIHTTNENVPPNMKDVHHFQLYGPHSPWYHTKFRPGTHDFLKSISQMYELHICTFGARAYAHHIASLLDHDGKYFSHRILSRDESFNTTSKTGNLKALFPCGDSLVCIIDDREDVWNFSPNLVPVKPYNFFTQTGDINAPPGLEANPSSAIDFCSVLLNQLGEIKNYAERDGAKAQISPACGDPCAEGPKSNGQKEDVSPEHNADLESESTQVETDNENKREVESKATAELEKVQIEPNASPESDIKGKFGIKPDDIIESEAKAELEQIILKVEAECEDKLALVESVVRDDSTGQKGNCADSLALEKDAAGENCQSIEESPEMGTQNGCDEFSSNDSDDYLFYLEEILTMIHKAFYDMYDQMKAQDSGEVPDLKTVIPYVQRKVLKGTNIVFSGLIPTNANLEKSKLWTLAKSLGANVTKDLSTKPGQVTTHVVASKLGTAKVNQAKRMKGVHVVNPDWLACCAERWEHVDERLFPLRDGVVYKKHSHQNASSNLHRQVQHSGSQRPGKQAVEPVPCPVYDPVTGKQVRQPLPPQKAARKEEKFANSISPLLSFSSDQIEAMGREVDDACSEDSNAEDSSDDDEPGEKDKKMNRGSSSESSSVESLGGGNCPKGWKKRKRDDAAARPDDAKSEFGGVIFCEDDEPQTKSTRREFPSDAEENSNETDSGGGESIGSVDEAMAAAVEREFLS